ncbi:amidohydrolase family protein [Paracoccus aminovorans]|uniref:amidohydrolase family protein n=1 Tax=Paracoccus aminovorans TaxID=34004 RepID=UPI002B25F7DA|nr:amidohydrolase family protein [Paracoccus aminovorans]
MAYAADTTVYPLAAAALLEVMQKGITAEIGSEYSLRYAITLGAAYTLKLDAEIGSVEVGKRADFAVLHDDPQAVVPEKLREIGVGVTVFGGRPAEAGTL